MTNETTDTNDAWTIWANRLYDGTMVVSVDADYGTDEEFAAAHLDKVRESLYRTRQNKLPVVRSFALAHPGWDWGSYDVAPWKKEDGDDAR